MEEAGEGERPDDGVHPPVAHTGAPALHPPPALPGLHPPGTEHGGCYTVTQLAITVIGGGGLQTATRSQIQHFSIAKTHQVNDGREGS